ncbi:MAG TPA: DUF4402 domain-containing protein [Longimicrobiales bacterium]|nr:DUF4402 domain-containing protein [Longimicrobiales bacterium]
MRKIVVMAAAMLLGTTGAALAQTSDSDNAIVTLDVVAALSLTTTQNLDLGVTTAGTNATVLPTATAAGAFTAAGQANTPITVTYPATVNLAGPGANIVFTPSLTGDPSAANQAGAAAVASGSTVTLSGTGGHFFWLGGTATVPVGQASGTYSGTFTLSVAY